MCNIFINYSLILLVLALFLDAFYSFWNIPWNFFFKLRWANYSLFLKSISRWFLEIIEGAPGWHNPRPGNDYSKTMSLAISKCQVMLQMKTDKRRVRRNTATKAAFQSCPHLLDHWCPQTRAADLLGVLRNKWKGPASQDQDITL